MKTVEEIYQDMLTCFAQETGMALEGTGELAVRMYALAAQLYGLYAENAWTRRECFPQTASGAYLDYHAQLRGLIRNEASKAVGSLRFSVEKALTEDAVIPAGTVCMTAGLVRFVTTQATALSAGKLFVDVPAQAAEAGAGGNTPADTVRAMEVAPVSIAACNNPSPFSGGREKEGDETLRSRILDTYRRMPNGTNAAYYESQALAIEGVAAASVLPKNRGVGTVDVAIADGDGVPDPSLLATVQADLEKKREIAVDLRVLAPTPVTVNVAVQVAAREGYASADVQEQVKRAVSRYFDGTLLAGDVLLAQLGQLIYQVKGVKNYRITAPAADVTIQKNQLPVLGMLTVGGLS